MAVITYHARQEVEGLFYTDQFRNNIHGIYPRSLNLKSSTVGVGRIMEFLDISAAPSHVNGRVGLIALHFMTSADCPSLAHMHWA